MNFLEFHQKFSNDNDIVSYYIKLRYNNNITCNHCNSAKVHQRKNRARIFQCSDCYKDFSIFKGTIFENSQTDLRKWFYAIHLFLNGKKGISGLQLQREIGVTYKTAWRMLKQIRCAMHNEALKDTFDNIVEIDETYVGGKPRKGPNGKFDTNSKRGRGTSKTPVVGVKDRAKKLVYAKVALPNEDGKVLTGKQLMDVLTHVAKKGSIVMTDEFRSYSIVGKSGYIHYKIDHTKEFARGIIHTNGIESFWSILKRGVYGIYHSISVKYMQLYIDEFCFRYNNRLNPDIFDAILLQSFDKKVI